MGGRKRYRVCSTAANRGADARLVALPVSVICCTEAFAIDAGWAIRNPVLIIPAGSYGFRQSNHMQLEKSANDFSIGES